MAQLKYNYLFRKEINYTFWLKYVAFIMLTTKTKMKKSHLHVFEISKPKT